MIEIDVVYETRHFRLDVALSTDADRVGVTGPSGSGKSTLLRIVAGLEREADGTVIVDGDTWHDEDGTRVAPWKRKVGWLPQDALVFPHLDARGNLAYADPPARMVDQVVEALELGDRLDASADELSGGEAQRVALGRALLSAPGLLLLDEPFSALDERLTDRVTDFLDEWCVTRGCALLVAAHSRATTDRLTDEHLGLRDGRRIDDG
jgi:molybdate transport system ATP-binding protein